jgi:hypothetical protein
VYHEWTGIPQVGTVKGDGTYRILDGNKIELNGPGGKPTVCRMTLRGDSLVIIDESDEFARRIELTRE